jgi:stage V sporulation protein G
LITVTAVRVYPFDTSGAGGRTRAFAEVEVDGCLLIKGIRIMQMPAGGYFIGYPRQRARQDVYVDVVVPDREAARLIREAVMAEFRRLLEPAAEDGPPPGEG